MTSRSLLCVLALGACGGDDGGDPDNNPTDVAFGTTAIVVVVNPIVNDANTETGLPTPGTVREGVTLTTDDDVTATTGPDGIAVLAPSLQARARSLSRVRSPAERSA